MAERAWDGGRWTIRTPGAPTHGPGNQLTGLTGGALTAAALRSILEEVVPWFDEASCSMRLRVRAADADDDLGQVLADAGLVVDEVEAWMAAPLEGLVVDAPTHDIQLADEPPSLDAYVDAFCRGWGVTSDLARAISQAALGPHPGPPGWRRYVARRDGDVAGEAILSLFDDVAYLAEASTIPAHRRRGVQRALIARRLADARDLGCRWVFSAVR